MAGDHQAPVCVSGVPLGRCSVVCHDVPYSLCLSLGSDLLFCNDNRELVKQSGVVGRDILSRLGAMWNVLDAEEKKVALWCCCVFRLCSAVFGVHVECVPQRYKKKADVLKATATGAVEPAAAPAAPVAAEVDEDRTETDTDREAPPETESKRKHKHKKKKKRSKHRQDDEE